MSSYLVDKIVDLIIKHLAPKVDGLEAQLLADDIVALVDEWISTDLYA